MIDETIKEMPLTPFEIKIHDTFTVDKLANENTLRAALQYHSNCFAAIRKTEIEFWDNLRERFELAKDKSYTLKLINGNVCVIETKEIEK